MWEKSKTQLIKLTSLLGDDHFLRVLHFLEINPLPGLDHIYSDLPIMRRLAGVKYTEIINAIVNAAWQRYQCG